MMRVAHFIQRYPPALGGSEAYFARLSQYLASQGDDVSVFTSTAIDLEAFWRPQRRELPPGITEQEGVHVRRYSLLRFPARRYILKAASLTPWRRWQCLTLPCNPICGSMWRDAGHLDSLDIVHASAFPYAFPIVCGLRLARRLRVPFVITPFLHLGDPDDPNDPVRRAYTTPALRWLLRQADALLVQTTSERDLACSLGINAHQVHLQGLGVDTAACTGGQRETTRQHWGASSGDILLGHLANQSVEKGTVDLLRAVEMLWAKNVPVRVVLAGPQMSNFLSYWEDACKRWPLAWRERVTQLGVVSEQDKRDFFAGIDVFVLPSRSDSFGLVLLEAWANGHANIAYRAGGVADLIRHDADGLLVPCGNVTALAAAMETVWSQPDLRQRLGDTGQQRVASEFRWPDKLSLVRDLYRNLTRK